MDNFPLIPDKVHHLNHLELGNIDGLPVAVAGELILITRFGDFKLDVPTNTFTRLKRLDNGEKNVFSLPAYGWKLGSGIYQPLSQVTV